MSAPTTRIIDRSTPLLRARIRLVFKQLPGALVGNEKALHEMRVAGRRLRVALPLLAARPRSKRARRAARALRALTRTAGLSRDYDVSVALFSERVKSREGVTTEMRALRRRLRGAQRRSHRRLVEALLDLEIARLRRDLRAVLKIGGAVVFTVRARLRERRDTVGVEVLKGWVQLLDRYDPPVLHRWRTRTRRLRYMAEIGETLMGQQPEASLSLKELQTALGDVHDAHVLSSWLERQAANARRLGADALAHEAGSESAWFSELSRAHHRAIPERVSLERLQRALETLGAPLRPAATSDPAVSLKGLR